MLRQDVIADEEGRAWLIEANCPPNLFAYTNEPDHPDEKAITPLIRAMLTDLIVSRHRTPNTWLACSSLSGIAVMLLSALHSSDGLKS